MLVREGSLAEVVSVVENVDEFVHKETVISLQSRLGNKRGLVLVAEHDGQLLGFKIGYEIDSTIFYSWFGGVARHARHRGVAQALLDYQEKWVKEHEYKKITVKSRNQYPSMLRLLLKNGYLIEGVDKRTPLVESRIMFSKCLFDVSNDSK
ncbi:GNAT family N-acetyltransferase [Vibrio sp. E150_011]